MSSGDREALRETEARLEACEEALKDAKREGKLWCAEVARLPSKQAAEAFGRVREALDK